MTSNDDRGLELSVIVPAHNEEAAIANQIDAITSSDWDGTWELIVVDNGSTDATAEIVRGYGQRDPRVRLVQAGEQPGRNYARNVGINASTARSFALTDADDIAGSGWVRAIGTALRDHELVTGPLELGRLNSAFMAASRGRRHESISPTFHNIFPAAHGNNFGMQRAAWTRIGGFDEDPRLLGSEDIEISMRAWLAGIRLYFATDAVVHYRYRTEPRVLWQQGRRYGRSRPMLVRKLIEAGRARPPRFGGWRSWAWLAVHVPDLLHPEPRAGWVWVAANRLGQLDSTTFVRCAQN
ncbi:MAG: glycosyltransferase, partial [Acidimicrobiia bacterium]